MIVFSATLTRGIFFSATLTTDAVASSKYGKGSYGVNHYSRVALSTSLAISRRSSRSRPTSTSSARITSTAT